MKTILAKRTLSIFTIISVLSFTTFLAVSSFIYAAEDTGDGKDCKPELSLSTKLQAQNGTTKQSNDFHGAVNMVKFGSVLGMGENVDTIMGCEKKFRTAAEIEALDTAACDHTAEPICDSLNNQGKYLNAAIPNRGAVSGSLLGLGYAVKNYTDNNPPPVNLAFFWNKTIEPIPFVNKAFAATTYPIPLLDNFFVLWQSTRNLALAMMAVILLVIGFMIILRKKVDSQTVVTVQYAIPKIVLSFILIIFSYPIGAIIASLGYNLVGSAWTIADSLVGGGSYPPTVSVAALIGIVTASIFAAIGTGGAGLIAVAVVGIVAVIIFYVYYELKRFFLYLKIVFSVLTAPLEFAIAAIPGNDARLMAWFKRMATYALTMFLMSLVIPIAYYMSITLLNGVNGFGQVVGVIASPLIVIYAYGMAISMEDKVKGFIDPQTTGKKR